MGFLRRVPMPSIQAYLEAYGRAQALYASCGITTAQEGMMPLDLAPLYKALLASGILQAGYCGLCGYGAGGPGDGCFPGEYPAVQESF